MFVRMFVDVFVVRMIFETTTLCDLDATLAKFARQFFILELADSDMKRGYAFFTVL